jgi:tetratricopeptide (TPR) repeat protein
METSRNWLSRFTRTTIAVAVLGATVPAMAANELAIKTLLDQAQYWQSKGRGDLSAEAWKKLLLLDPNNVDALALLAQFELDNNRPEQAKLYTDRLKTVKGGDAAARRVESAVAARSVDNRQLDEARALARGGKSDEAARAYRQVLGGKTPSGPLALEYYQTMGGSEAGWEEARQGLARLSAEDPNNKQISLAYGQHLTYRGATRREGIRILSQLSRLPEFTKVATEAWRKGLIWLEASKSDVPLFQSFLTAVPGDGAIKSRLDTLTRVDPPAKPDPKVIALRNGFAALNAGDLEQASERFERLLAENANNTDALGGLGVIRLKQEKFAEAERYLSQATKGQQNLAKWGTALASARFWLAMDAGNAHREAGQRDLAIAQFTRAQRLDSTQSLPVLALADLAAEDGKLAEADRAYRQVLAKEPDSLDALRGLVNVMAQQGQIEEATRLADRLTPEMREKLGGYGQLKGEQLRRAATNATQRGDHASAVQLLEDALLWDPSSPWLRLELGRLYQAAGSLSDARAVVDGLLVSNPNLPSALYASALMSADAQDWLAGLDQLERIPPNSRNKEMMALQRRLWVRAQADRASVLARSGQIPAAKQLLRQIEPSAERDGELLLAVAQAMSDAGEDTRALAMMRTMISQNRQPDLGMMVQYSAILLKTRQDAELAAQMRHLYTQPLNEQQRNDLDKIRVAYSLRQFDSLREAGNIATAYEAIMPLVAERPDDITLQLALARLYASAKEYKDALAWYDYALQREPDNLDALVAAAGAALAVPNLDYAESAINNAAQIAPENPAVLTTLGKLYRAQGKTQLATQTFQRALSAEQSASRQLVNGPLGMRLINYTLPSADGLGVSGIPSAQGSPVIPKIAPPLAPRSMNVPGRSPAMRPISKLDSSADTQYTQVARLDLPSPSPSPSPAPSVLNKPSAPSASSAMSTAEQIVPVQYTYPSANQGAREPVVPQPTQIMPVQSLQQLPSARMTGQLQPLQLIQPNQAQTLEIVSPGALPLPPSRSSYVDPTTGNIVSNISRNDPLVASKDTLAIRDEIEELRALRSPSVAGGGMWRSRNGDSGTSSLSDFSVPIEGKMPVGDGGHMVLRVTPVLLDAGQISKSDLNTAQRFGTNAFASSNTFTNSNSNQQAAGVAFGLGYESLRLKADIASTPIGFKVSTAVGGVSYADRLGDMSIKLDLSRRSVTDSLLSYAGTVDDRTGTIWGGVTATGGRAELGLEDGRFGVFGYGSYHYVGGKGVVDNNRYEGGAGAYYKVAQDANMELTAGVSVTALGYDKNLRYFTLGHGGYFSPQRYFALNFPVEWSGRTGQLSYKLEGSLGIQNFRENTAAYFPGSTSLQTAWETAAATANSAAGGPAGVTWKTSYPGQTKTGMGFRLSSAVEYRLAPKWVIGGRLALDNASDYFQSSGLLYVRYSFEPNTRPVNFPPNTLRVNQL